MARMRAWHFGAIGIGSILAIAGALAFPKDRMELRLGKIGPQLVGVVGLIGTVYADISKETVRELVKDRERIFNKVSKDLVDANIALESHLKESDKEKTLSLAVLEADKRAAFLALFPPDERASVDKRNAVTMDQLLKRFLAIQTNIKTDTVPFLHALKAADSSEADIEITNRLGIARSSFLLSLNQLVTFSATLQRVAYQVSSG